MTTEYYTFKNGEKYPISESLYHKDGFCGHCNICDEWTIGYCAGCPKWLCDRSRCIDQHGKDETEGWS